MKPFVLLLALSAFAASTAHAATAMEISGTWTYRTDQESLEMLGDTVCFTPDKAALARYPVMNAASRDSWFCFSNTAKAMELLAIRPTRNGCGVEGKATVSVTEYVPYRGEGDDNDTARLLSAKAVTAARPLTC